MLKSKPVMHKIKQIIAMVWCKDNNILSFTIVYINRWANYINDTINADQWLVEIYS